MIRTHAIVAAELEDVRRALPPLGAPPARVEHVAADARLNVDTCMRRAMACPRHCGPDAFFCTRCGEPAAAHRTKRRETRPQHKPDGDPCGRCGRAAASHRIVSGRRGRRTTPRLPLSALPFVGVDGEGVNVGGRHRYVYLTASDEHGRKIGSIRDVGGLSTRACLDWLLSLRYPSGKRLRRLFAFGFGYDASCILRELPADAMGPLVRPDERRCGLGHSPVTWAPERGMRYCLNFLRGRWSFRRQSWDKAEKAWKTEARCTVWDVQPFFASTFTQALADWRTCEPAIIAMVEGMKARRREFSLGMLDEIEAYSDMETGLLAKMVRRLYTAFADAGIPLTRWHGPGSAAATVLRQMGVHLALQPCVEEWALKASMQPLAWGAWPTAAYARESMFAGRIARPGTRRNSVAPRTAHARAASRSANGSAARLGKSWREMGTNASTVRQRLRVRGRTCISTT